MATLVFLTTTSFLVHAGDKNVKTDNLEYIDSLSSEQFSDYAKKISENMNGQDLINMTEAISKSVQKREGLYKMSTNQADSTVYLTCITLRGGVLLIGGRIGKCFGTDGEAYTLKSISAGIHLGDNVHSGRGGIASLLFGSVGVNDVDNNIKGTYFGSELSAASGYGADAVMAFKDGKMLFLAGPGIGRIFAGSFISGININ